MRVCIFYLLSGSRSQRVNLNNVYVFILYFSIRARTRFTYLQWKPKLVVTISQQSANNTSAHQ